VVISTGKSDWKQYITDEEHSLAAALSQVMPSLPEEKQSPGLFSSTDSKRISVLNGSHRSLSCEHDRDTVLVFPDYKCIFEVSRSHQGALELWQSAVDPLVGRGGTDVEGHLKTWVLPYASVILLCMLLMASHVL
jgi:hypothetical protein